MGYLHIDNLYKNQDVLLFKEVYCLEKIHGTSCHISFSDKGLHFFSGGANHEQFCALFDQDRLIERFNEIYNGQTITIYGEGYGGKLQGMSATYGKELKFIVFDVKIGDSWLSVPQAQKISDGFGLEFVWWTQCNTDINVLNHYRDQDSMQAIRNGLGSGKIAEGIIIRPLIELTTNNGKRIIAKHKRDEFLETKTKREVTPEQLQMLTEANAVAEEWVTVMRLEHILDKITKEHTMEITGEVIKNMSEDIQREGEGEIAWSKEVEKAIGKLTAKTYKQYLQRKLEDV